jgi:formamidopyrimidine-DNA glycosylase
MPELPEIAVIAKQMNDELENKTISKAEILQPKILNVSTPQFGKMISGKSVARVFGRGKWLFIELKPDNFLLINLGMGADLLYFEKSQKLPDKYQFKLIFLDGSGFTARFWWFGYVHVVQSKKLGEHKMTSLLGKSPIDADFTLDYFRSLVHGKKGAVKSFLLDQKNVAGIGNVYVQDILFKARLHPLGRLSSLSQKEIDRLYGAITDVLCLSIKLGGLAYEKDFYGHRGRFAADKFLVGYREGKPCPDCGSIVEKIKAGSTSSYVCPKCQKLD